MENFLLLIILAVIFAAVIIYLVKAKKKGVKCIGCPYANTCGKNAENNSCGCNMNN